jgi:CBS domain-containing protein
MQQAVLRARDVMTSSVVAIDEGATVGEAISRMAEARVSGLPVIDGAGHLAGVLTEGDLLRRSETGTEKTLSRWAAFFSGPGGNAEAFVRAHSRKVADLMSRDLVTTTPDAPLADVVGLMEQRHVKRVPVLQDGKLVGIVARADVVRMLGRAIAAAKPETDPDEVLRARIYAALRGQKWLTEGVQVRVEGGRAILEGVVTDDRVRDAVRVAVENVPGVQGVDDQVTWVDPTLGMPPGAL